MVMNTKTERNEKRLRTVNDWLPILPVHPGQSRILLNSMGSVVPNRFIKS